MAVIKKPKKASKSKKAGEAAQKASSKVKVASFGIANNIGSLEEEEGVITTEEVKSLPI